MKPNNPCEAFLDFVADTTRFELDVDGEQVSSGRWIDHSRVYITCHPADLEALIKGLGFTDYDRREGPVAFLIRKVAEPPVHTYFLGDDE
jgi:hypothetical protein